MYTHTCQHYGHVYTYRAEKRICREEYSYDDCARIIHHL